MVRAQIVTFEKRFLEKSEVFFAALRKREEANAEVDRAISEIKEMLAENLADPTVRKVVPPKARGPVYLPPKAGPWVEPFELLVYNLCTEAIGPQEPKGKKNGRPRHDLHSLAFIHVMAARLNQASRKLVPNIQAWTTSGWVERSISYNAVIQSKGRDEMTTLLKTMFQISVGHTPARPDAPWGIIQTFLANQEGWDLPRQPLHNTRGKTSTTVSNEIMASKTAHVVSSTLSFLHESNFDLRKLFPNDTGD